jgi:Xylose isomerase-like TIM barrel
MPTQPSLLAACWTSAGNAVTFRGLTTSPVDIRTRIEAVAEAGYTGFGLTREDLVVARETVGLSAVATMLADNGIETVQLEWITNWWTAGETRRASDEVRHDLFDACPVLGVDNIKVGADDDGVPVSYDQLCHGFDVLATDAARVGVKIGFENTPFSHHVKTTEQAIRFITDVANPNGGLVVDIWHAQRGGTLPMPTSRGCSPSDTSSGSSSTTATRSRRGLTWPTHSTTAWSAEPGPSTSSRSSARSTTSAGRDRTGLSTCRLSRGDSPST